jgi:hypothetical protein
MRIPVVLQKQCPWAEQALLDDQNRYWTVPIGSPSTYTNGIEVGCGQTGSPRADFNSDSLDEYQEWRQRATSEKKELLTLAQRRRKAQNRAAYVSGSPTFPDDSYVDTSRCL